MPARFTKISLWLAVIALLGAAWPSAASERFEKVWCLRYAEAPNAPLSGLLAGAPRDAMLDLPFAMCVARSPSQVVVLDAGFVEPQARRALRRPRLGGVRASARPRWA